MPEQKAHIGFKLALLEGDLKQKDLADRFGVSSSEVSRWAHGLAPRQDLRKPVARVLKRKPQELWPHYYQDHNGRNGS